MSISSMTGFARTECTENGYSWSWEIRSVNARSLDARHRLPTGMERLDVRLKPEVTKKFQRGNISATLTLVRPPKQTSLSVNSDVLNQLLDLANDIAGRIKATPPSIDGLLSVPGVLDTVYQEESDFVQHASERATRKA